MNYTTYLNMMISLMHELERISSAKPYDPEAYKRVIFALNSTSDTWYRSRRRQPWAALFFCIFLLIVLLLIVWQVLSVLYTEGIQ